MDLRFTSGNTENFKKVENQTHGPHVSDDPVVLGLRPRSETRPKGSLLGRGGTRTSRKGDESGGWTKDDHWR